MKLKELVKERLAKRALEEKDFWNSKKKRLLASQISNEDQVCIVDVEEISSDCVDILIIRKEIDGDSDYLENCRVTAKAKLFRKPVITFDFSVGPSVDDLLD